VGAEDKLQNYDRIIATRRTADLEWNNIDLALLKPWLV